MPFEWFREAADPDSSGSRKYWTAYGKRLGADQLIFCEMLPNDSIRVSGWKSGAMTGISVLKWSTAFSDSVIIPTAEAVAGISGLESVDSLSVVLPDGSNRDYWNGRYQALIDSHQTAIRYFNQIPASMQSNYTLLKKAESIIGKGEQEQIAGGTPQLDYLEAESLLDSLSTDSRIACDWRYSLARLRVNQAAWTRAEQVIRILWAQCDERPELYMLMSRLHPERFQSMGFSDRKQLFEKALKLNPASVKAAIALGDWYYFHQKIPKAELVYKKLLAINPRSYDGLMALGKIYLYRAETLKLIEILEQVRKYYPDQPEVLYNLGIAYYNQNEFDQAAQLFQIAAESYQYANAYYYLGATFLKLQNYTGAINAFRKRIELRKGNKDTFADEAVKQLYRLLHDPELTESAHDSIP